MYIFFSRIKIGTDVGVYVVEISTEWDALVPLQIHRTHYQLGHGHFILKPRPNEMLLLMTEMDLLRHTVLSDFMFVIYALCAV